MWRGQSDLLLTLLPLLIIWISISTECHGRSTQFSPPTGTKNSLSIHQLHSLVRDALKYLDRANQPERPEPKIRYFVEPHYSGLVKLRAIRSNMGDVENFLRLYQLQELENKYGNKARPRFGKRSEVLQANFLPPYGYQPGDEDESNDAKVSHLHNEEEDGDRDEDQRRRRR